MKKILILIKEIILLPLRPLEVMILYMPGALGYRLRYYYWKLQLKKLGKKVRIEPGVSFQSPQFISIGNHCWIDRNVIIIAGWNETERIVYYKKNTHFKYPQGDVVIGDYVHIAPNVLISGIAGVSIGNNIGIASGAKLYSFSHHYKNNNDIYDKKQYFFTPLAAIHNQSMIAGAIVIADNCAITVGAVIMAGVTIGEGAWIGANVVIQKDIAAQTVVSAATDIQYKDISDYQL